MDSAALAFGLSIAVLGTIAVAMAILILGFVISKWLEASRRATPPDPQRVLADHARINRDRTPYD